MPGVYKTSRLTKGEIINYTTRANGIFEVIEPVMEQDEILDSALLEETVVSLIKQGKRNFTIDLSKLDYLYSDSMNKFLSINKKVLDVSGRLSLLAPTAEVRQILERAGIHNFLTIYDSEEDLVKAQEEMIKHTQTISLDAIRVLKETEDKPESEFEDFRTEIGKAFQTEQDDIHSDFQSPSASAPSFEPPQNSTDIPQPQNPNFTSPQSQSQQDQQFTPPPPPIQSQVNWDSNQQFQQPNAGFAGNNVPPVQPPQGQQQGNVPEFTPSFSNNAPEQTFQPSAPVFENQDQRTPTPFEQPKSMSEKEVLSHDPFEEDEKSGFPVGILIGGLVLVLLIAVGLFIFKDSLTGANKKSVADTTSAPVLSLSTESESDTDTEESSDITQPEQIAKSKTPVAKKSTAIRKNVRRKKTYSSPKKSTRRKPVRSVAPKPTAISAKNALIINSEPSGATVKIDGQTKGTTPYKWLNPTVYGMVSISVEKPGYETSKKNVKFVGGIVKENVILRRTAVARTATPATRYQSKPRNSRSSSRRQPVQQKKVSTPPPTTVAPVASKASSGAPGTIFIASLPPVADVYMDGNRIGKTNVEELKIKSGTHTMRFVKGAKEITKQMTFQPGKNASKVVRIP